MRISPIVQTIAGALLFGADCLLRRSFNVDLPRHKFFRWRNPHRKLCLRRRHRRVHGYDFSVAGGDTSTFPAYTYTPSTSNAATLGGCCPPPGGAPGFVFYRDTYPTAYGRPLDLQLDFTSRLTDTPDTILLNPACFVGMLRMRPVPNPVARAGSIDRARTGLREESPSPSCGSSGGG